MLNRALFGGSVAKGWHKHGLYLSYEYRVWQRAKSLCYQKSRPLYAAVGGVGIKMCDEWKDDPGAFVLYIGKQPSKKHLFQRIDRNKDYEPGNVEWTTKKYQPEKKVHGLTWSDEYRIWCKIKGRCLNTNNPAYKDYGGRGITMCEAWRVNFTDFFDYIGARPSKKHSIDRIDNERGYEPGNVRWATMTDQARNRRSNRMIQICCHTKSMAEWCEIHKVKYPRTNARLDSGWETLAAFDLAPPPVYWLFAKRLNQKTD